MREAARFVCKWEPGVVLQPNKLASDKKGIFDETVASVLAVKNPH